MFASLLKRRNKGVRPHIPQLAGELTAEWFTQVLGNGDTVTAVRCKAIGTDIGFMGEVLRCELTWDGGSDDGIPASDRPASVIVKIPTSNSENFALGDTMKAYEREIVVYRTVGETLGLPMPRCYHSAMDPDPAPWLDRPVAFLLRRLPISAINWLIGKLLKPNSQQRRRYLLVLEDITGARPPTQRDGGSFDDVSAALELLAHFHAHNWMRSDVLESYSRFWPINQASRAVQANYVRNRESFVQRYGVRIDDATMARLDDVQRRVPAIEASLAAAPWTLLHGDYRLDNLLFLPDDQIVVLDFQGLAYGRPAFDVAYFITMALTIDHRDNEEVLLRTYHDALVVGGVTSYSWDDLLHDCMLTKEMLAHRCVGAADILDTEVQGGGAALIDVMQLRVLDWLD